MAADAPAAPLGSIVLLSALDMPFLLPSQLEAGEPPEVRGAGRDDVRLLVTAGGSLTHTHFRRLADFLRPGDALVLNASATLPAAIEARSAGGDSFRLHVSTQLPGGLAIVEPRGATVFAGEKVTLAGSQGATLIGPYRASRRLWIAAFTGSLRHHLNRYGKPISYPYVRREWPIEAYQNVYSRVPGSAEMPSAGRPITSQMLAGLRARGIIIAFLTLHAGVASMEHDEPPCEEYYEVPADTAAKVAQARARGNSVIAVGTTVIRALESSIDPSGTLVASRGWTDLVIGAAHPVRFADGLLTGFHEPRSTHLAMLAAVAGSDEIRRAYGAAIDGGYLWHEFGDSHLILPAP
ncbi:MAG: S-adenosylmethionine:tRNA ribosyltransferase-isomerase [Candidatus Eremiobacteraeota bacterium]|nr:S-adenosylmethionine:tRNA ribosyltransferase-isomerase [Candidatus Eremiobacteraeota bacterium]MBC5827754.1 S-adenosylmethionine:tRNA ribosyltransferase-isomerase [Candidatus Eremiobacteraeota bacterium]